MAQTPRTHSIDYTPKNGKGATHGMSSHYLYYCWLQMKQRTENPKAKQYKDYGGRGIKICREWKNNVKTFFDWAIINGYAKGLTIERKDNNGDYTPDNCKFVNRFEQQRNRRNNTNIVYMGQTKTLTEWAAILDTTYVNLYNRLHIKKMPIEKAFDLSITAERKKRPKKIFDKEAAIKMGGQIREALDGRKQRWLAEKTGISEYYLSNKLNGEFPFNSFEIERINILLDTKFALPNTKPVTV